MRRRRVWPVVLLAMIACAPRAGQSPDLVLVNGRIFTGDPARPWVEALAITADRISAVGATADIHAQAGSSTQAIDLLGQLVIPGLNDAHTHVGALPPASVLGGPPAAEHDPTLAEVLQRLELAAARAPRGTWITGEIGGVVLDDPKATRFALDAVAPDHLVVLQSWTGHGTLANTSALRRLGIADDEADPPGGFYGRMPGSTMVNGVVHEYAQYHLIERRLRESTEDAHVAAFGAFAQAAASFGITSIQTMALLPLEQVVDIATKADLPVRVRVIDWPLAHLDEWSPLERPSRPLVTIGGTKLVLDGTPVERLMLLRAPYADRPTRGRSNWTSDELRRFFERARAAREQPLVHAVGDGAIDLMLQALDVAGGEAWRPLRPRIEHGDLLQPDQFALARRVGAVVVQNPSHFTIGDTLRPRLGAARMSTTQPLKSLIVAGIPLALGSDGPLNPFLNMMFAVTHPANPDEALTIDQAVKAYTRGAAFAEHREQEKGTLAPGLAADLAVLSQNIFNVAASDLPKTTSVLTIVAGRIVHDARPR